jgi:hypothetical protein
MEGLFADGDSMYLLLVVIVAVLWIFLSFAIFGTKDRLDRLIVETSKTNKLLEEILDEVSRSVLNLEVEQIINAPRRSFDPPVGVTHLQRKQTVENQNLHKTPINAPSD